MNEAYRVLNQEARKSESRDKLEAPFTKEPQIRRRSSGNIRVSASQSSPQVKREQSFPETVGNEDNKTKSPENLRDNRKNPIELRNRKNTKQQKQTKKPFSKSNSTTEKTKNDSTVTDDSHVRGELVRPPSILSNHFANENGTFEYPDDEDQAIDAAEEFSSRVHGINLPEKELSLTRVYGYKSDCHNGNLVCLKSSEVAYAVGAIVVIWSSSSGVQRFYTEHTRDIDSLACHEGRIIASLETLFLKEDNHHVRVKIWNSPDLKTITTFNEPLKDQQLIGIYFSPNGSLLILKGTSEAIYGRIWDWRSSRKKVSTAFYVSSQQETVLPKLR